MKNLDPETAERLALKVLNTVEQAAIRSDDLDIEDIAAAVLNRTASQSPRCIVAAALDGIRAQPMIRRDLRVNGAFYVAPVFNVAIADGKKIGVFHVVQTSSPGMAGYLAAYLSGRLTLCHRRPRQRDRYPMADHHRNCFAACVASLLELPIEDVPNFQDEHQCEWLVPFSNWLRQFGLFPLICLLDQAHDSVKDYIRKCGAVYIAGGLSERDSSHACIYTSHACICMGSELLHDPHPDGKGLNTIADMTFFVPIEGSRPRFLAGVSESREGLNIIEDMTFVMRSPESTRGRAEPRADWEEMG
jgi:hypothetical protein